MAKSILARLFAHRCYHGGKQHKLQAVYTEVESSQFAKLLRESKTFKIGGRKDAPGGLLTKSIYLHHICLWCGSAYNYQMPDMGMARVD